MNRAGRPRHIYIDRGRTVCYTVSVQKKKSYLNETAETWKATRRGDSLREGIQATVHDGDQEEGLALPAAEERGRKVEKASSGPGGWARGQQEWANSVPTGAGSCRQAVKSPWWNPRTWSHYSVQQSSQMSSQFILCLPPLSPRPRFRKGNRTPCFSEITPNLF